MNPALGVAVPAASPRAQPRADAGRVILRQLGRSDYAAVLARMREFTATRDGATEDELWLTEHAPVYTLGLAARVGHVRESGAIPVLKSDRGGQVTYHGPGQVIAYMLIDLARRGLTVRAMVRLTEHALIATLAQHGIAGQRRDGMPGVFVGAAKIAALGFKVRSGRSYHGASLNVDVDLAPYAGIDACGYPGLASTSMAALGCGAGADVVGAHFAQQLMGALAARDNA